MSGTGVHESRWRKVRLGGDGGSEVLGQESIRRFMLAERMIGREMNNEVRTSDNLWKKSPYRRRKLSHHKYTGDIVKGIKRHAFGGMIRGVRTFCRGEKYDFSTDKRLNSY